MIDHVLGRPSVKSRRLQVLTVLAFWSAYMLKGDKHGPPLIKFLSRFWTKRLTAWQTVVLTMIYLYVARNFSTLVNLASPEPMANMYDNTYFRATWVLTALDAGFWTAMKIRSKWLRDLASVVFSAFYLVAAEKADEKVRKVRGMLTVDHLRVSWNKGTTPYLRFFQGLLRPRLTRWPPRAIRIPRPAGSDYKEPVSAWLYYDGPLSDLARHKRLVIDIPGGGFVAMDPRCNDDKLFAWAVKTGLPVLSLDYKKAPEFPYPYALNECFDVYSTIIKTKGRCIGMSGTDTPRIILTGDSAGGNLATSTTLMIIERTHQSSQPYSVDGDLPVPDGLVLFYPGLDMNIGNWMSDDQMSLMKDRRNRGTNRSIVRRKSMQYNDLVGTPHQSDDEDDASPPKALKPLKLNLPARDPSNFGASTEAVQSPQPQPQYSHTSPHHLTNSTKVPSAAPSDPKRHHERQPSGSFHAEPLRTRLAMSSMISYFNDRVLTPEMMRAMIILYIGPHNRPDFSQDYLLSPVLAPDTLLAKFPRVYFLTGERDPLVDDTVIFAARLRKAKEAEWMRQQISREESGEQDDAMDDGAFDDRDVAQVALLPGVSHGFLQFPAIYPPAWGFIDRCADWIGEIFSHADRERARVAERSQGSHNRKRSAGTDAARGLTSATSGVNAHGKHHVRTLTESSGEEDRPLEMAMTSRNGKGKDKEGGATSSRKISPETRDIDEVEDGKGQEVRPKARKSVTRKKSGPNDQKLSMVKLKSSEDLLGRRMQGLAGGLTGVGEED